MRLSSFLSAAGQLGAALVRRSWCRRARARARLACGLGLSLAVACPLPAIAHDGCDRAVQLVESVSVTGNRSTTDGTLLALLPRRPPERFSAAELAEFERRLHNLGIFDRVTVECRGNELSITLREKWTLVPQLDFATGKTFEDSYALVGLTEYNLLGTANQLSLSAYREQRGFGFAAAFVEHRYRRHAWAFSSELSFGTASLRFEGGGWRTASLSIELTMRSPPWLHEYLNYASGLILSRETAYAAVNATPPPNTQLIQPYMGFVWDAYYWNDLVPSGVRAALWITFGGLFGTDPPLPRHTMESRFEAALALGGQTAIVSRLNGAIGTRGNVNYSFLLGSVGGVRGLRDGYYFNWVQLFSNIELRTALDLGRRWALQGVLFADSALFESMNEAGERGSANAALSLGLGVRLVPTWLSSIVFRVDAARLMVPEQAWFGQFGLNQYF